MQLLRAFVRTVAECLLSVIAFLIVITGVALFITASLGALYLADNSDVALGWISP